MPLHLVYNRCSAGTVILTCYIAFVFVIDFAHLAITKCQLPHPIHSTLDSCGTMISIVPWATEAISGKIVVAKKENAGCWIRCNFMSLLKEKFWSSCPSHNWFLSIKLSSSLCIDFSTKNFQEEAALVCSSSNNKEGAVMTLWLINLLSTSFLIRWAAPQEHSCQIKLAGL